MMVAAVVVVLTEALLAVKRDVHGSCLSKSRPRSRSSLRPISFVFHPGSFESSKIEQTELCSTCFVVELLITDTSSMHTLFFY